MERVKSFDLTKTACYIGYVIQAVVNNLSSLLFVVFNAEPYNISLEKLGSLIFINFAFQLFIDYISVYFISQFGYKKCVVFAQATSVIGFVLLGILPKVIEPYFGVLFATLFLAFGSGMIEVLISPIFEALPSDNKAGNMSFLHSFYCWGQVLTVIGTTALLLALGRKNWFLIPFFWAVLPLFNTCIFAKSNIVELKSDTKHSRFISLFKHKSIYKYMLFMFCAGASEITMVQWASFFVEKGFGTEKWLGDLIGPCLFAVLMGLGRITYAVLGNGVSLERIISVSSALCILCYLLVALSNNGILCALGCAICGLSVSVMWPGVLSLSAEKFSKNGTTVFSLMAMLGDIGCAVGPWLLGIIAEYAFDFRLSRYIIELLNINSTQSSMQFGFLVCSIFPLMMFVFFVITAVRNRLK